MDQRLLYDQRYKYNILFAPAQRLSGTLLTAHLQHASAPAARLPLVADLRMGWYGKEFTRGELEEEPDFRFGAFTGSAFRMKGEDLARAGYRRRDRGRTRIQPALRERTIALGSASVLPDRGLRR